MSVDVEELRTWSRNSGCDFRSRVYLSDAADEMESLRAERDALRWRPVSEPPEDTSGLWDFWSTASESVLSGFRWGQKLYHDTHYRRFVAPGEA